MGSRGRLLPQHRQHTGASLTGCFLSSLGSQARPARGQVPARRAQPGVSAERGGWWVQTGTWFFHACMYAPVALSCLLVRSCDSQAPRNLSWSAGKLLLENYEEYASHARLMTSIHAQTARRPGPLTQSGGNASTGNAAATAGDGQNKEGGSPAKKAKAETAAAPATKAAAAAKQVKKSLKRL